MAENTTRKHLLYSSQTQKVQSHAKLNKGNTPSLLRCTEASLGFRLMSPDLFAVPLCFSHDNLADELPFLSSSGRFLV